MAAAPRPCTSPDWSDLPTDLLRSILQLLDLPGDLAFASVCASWCSVAVAAGVPHLRTPWLMSWEDPAVKHPRSAVTCELRRPLVDVDRVYKLTFPEGAFVTCCGASGGWLVVVDELCNLSLHNPLISRTIPLPPVTDFPCVEAVRDGQGNITCYRLRSEQFDDAELHVYDAYHLASFFYRKAVVSGDPSGDGDYAVTVIHHGGEWVSHVRAGDARWQVLVPNMKKRWRNNRYPDAYADCAYHDGSIYAVSYWGKVDRWALDDGRTPSTKEEAVHYQGLPWRQLYAVLTRHLVVPPGGSGVWLVSAVWEPGRPAYPDAVRFTFHEVARGRGNDVEDASRRESVQAHALFLGMNQSAYLPSKSFSGVRPGVLYFSAPWMRQYASDQLERVGDWGGARAYDLKAKTRTFERVVPGLLPASARLMDCPTEVWITPNLY